LITCLDESSILSDSTKTPRKLFVYEVFCFTLTESLTMLTRFISQNHTKFH